MKISDGTNKIKIPIHRKILLASPSPYFKKLLSCGLKEAGANKIILNVQNSHVACDIIASFYGQSTLSGNLADWYYAYEYIILSDYWGLSWDPSLVTNLCIPYECIEQFVELLDIVGPNDAIIDAINKNLPMDYDITKLPKCNVDKLLKKLPYDVVYASDMSILRWYSGDGSITKIKSNFYGPIIQISIIGNKIVCVRSHSVTIMDTTGNSVEEYIAKLEIINVVHVLDNQYIIMCTSKDIKIWNTINKDIISHAVPGMIGAQMIIVSRNGHQVVYTVGSDTMYIFRIKNTIEWKFVGMIQAESEITCWCDSPDGRFIITTDPNCNVKIWCVETGELVEVLFKSQDDKRLYLISHTISYSPDNLQLAYSDGEIIRIFDMVSMKLVRTLRPEIMAERLRINNIEYSPDSKHIICRLLNDAIMKVNMDTFKQSIVVSGYKLFAPNSNFKVGYVTNYETAMIYKKYLHE